MITPKMFTNKSSGQKVFIIKNMQTDEIFESPMSPKHFFAKESAEYTKQFMQLDEYEVVSADYIEEANEYI